MDVHKRIETDREKRRKGISFSLSTDSTKTSDANFPPKHMGGKVEESGGKFQPVRDVRFDPYHGVDHSRVWTCNHDGAGLSDPSRPRHCRIDQPAYPWLTEGGR